MKFAEEVELSGILQEHPVPSIRVLQGTSWNQQSVYQTVPLVAFGKIGGQDLLTHWDKHIDHWVKVKGKLIYYEGKALLEVNSTTALTSAEPLAQLPESFSVFSTEVQLLKGEVLDAKCYFGVMKPGHGKPHRILCHKMHFWRHTSGIKSPR